LVVGIEISGQKLHVSLQAFGSLGEVAVALVGKGEVIDCVGEVGAGLQRKFVVGDGLGEVVGLLREIPEALV
jgi:hypothetical protein